MWVFYQELRRDRAFVRAAGMAYASLIALVPMLVLAYGVLGAVGAGEGDIEVAFGALLRQVFGEVPGVRNVILPGLREVDLAALGAISVGGLLVVAARLYLMVEQAYCDMLGASVQRKFGYRLLNFYFTMTAVPVVLVVLTRGTFAIAGGSLVRDGFGLLLQYAMLVAALKLFPSLHVRWGPALMGAGVSFVLLELGRHAFGLYILLFASDDPLQVVYGSLGLVPLFLLWLYLIWVFVLLGVEVANVTQNYTSLYEAELEQLESAQPRFPSVDSALQVALRVADGFRGGQGAVSLDLLVERTGLDGVTVGLVAKVLSDGGILVPAKGGWLPSRAPDQIALAEVVAVWRASTLVRIPDDPVHERIDALLALPGTLADPLERVGVRSGPSRPRWS